MSEQEAFLRIFMPITGAVIAAWVIHDDWKQRDFMKTGLMVLFVVVGWSAFRTYTYITDPTEVAKLAPASEKKAEVPTAPDGVTYKVRVTEVEVTVPNRR